MNDDRNERIVDNAKRLLGDAVSLDDNGRYASAFALAVLGLEEIGKVILRRWNLLNGNARFHQSNLMAVVTFLFVGDVIRGASPEISDPSQLTPEAFERVANAVTDGETGRFNASVTVELIDLVKQFAHYYDGELEGADFAPDRFRHEDVVSIFKTCWSALNMINDDVTMRVAKGMFLAKKEERLGLSS